jgi:3-methyladenine DNA glycosylase AlkD
MADKLSKITARMFINELHALRKTDKADTAKYFTHPSTLNKFMGVRPASIFALAKRFVEMPLNEIEELLGSEYYEGRLGAVSIMDFQARDKKISSDRKKLLFDLYISKHGSIDNWDLVDRSAPYVVGGYLSDKPRKILYKLARSKDVWERRTAIVSTYFFIRQDEVDDTFKIAELLVNDKHEAINKAVGSWVREAGKRDKQRLLDFLDKHAATMPRVTLRYAIEKLDKRSKEVYMSAHKQS